MRYVADELVSLLREVFPRLSREWQETGRETMQFTVWIVGLSTGLLVLLATNETLMARLGASGSVIVPSVLSAAVALGVLQRFVYHLAEHNQRSINRDFYNYLVGMKSEASFPLPISDKWDRDEVIRRLEVDFDLNYSFLRQDNVALEGCREAYVSMYDLWKKLDEQATTQLARIVAAYSGQPIEENAARYVKQITEPSETDLESVRERASAVGRLHTMSYGLFVAASVAFVVGFLWIGISAFP